MQLRLASALVVLTLALGVTGCAQRIGGTAVAGAGKPPSTSTTSSKAKPTTSTSSTSTKPTSSDDSDVKIAVAKKTEGYEACEILKPDDVATAVGGKAVGEDGCVQSTEDPYAVVTQMVTFADHAEGDKKPVDVGGNTAWQVVDKEGDCAVIVMLTDDPRAITPAWVVRVLEVDDIDSCGIALKLSKLGFDRIPNA